MIWPLKPWWTPRYTLDKLALWRWEKRHPSDPWLTANAVEVLTSLLSPQDEGIEWGSGRSTIWFAGRVAKLTSIETDPFWYSRIEGQLRESDLTNVNYIFREAVIASKSHLAAYVGLADSFLSDSLDFALVDGLFRSACATRVLEKLRAGGLLIIDDVHRFLPSDSRSPKSRSWEDGPRRAIWWEEVEGMRWVDFLEAVKTWRCIWTSNGIKDTAIWVKPSH